MSSFSQIARRSGGRLSIPLTNAKLETIGMVNFEYIIVMPFQHPNLSIGSKQTYWKSVSTKVIGHRGAGANRMFSGGAGNLQIGENTILSLVTAASLGAEYVEFDVQLTKDHVPVIYHDWIVSETGLEIPVNAVSLKEFKKISPRTHVMFDRSKPRRRAKSGHNNSSWSDDENSSSGNGKGLEKSFSLENIDQSVAGLVITDDSESTQLTQRHLGGRADMAIKAPFATLEELFKVRICVNIFHCVRLFALIVCPAQNRLQH